MAALEENGVLVFRELHLDDETQMSFSKKLDDVGKAEPAPPPSIYKVSLDPTKTPHGRVPEGHRLLAHRRRPGRGADQGDDAQRRRAVRTGGETEFASTYAAFDGLSEEEKERFAALRVLHSFEASQRLVNPDPNPDELAQWREQPDREHPLVWRHRSGRRSLVIGATADHVVGMDRDEGRALLADLQARATDRTASTATSGRWAIWSSGTTPASCTGSSPTTPRPPARCTGRP